jgi:hypothetical protein
MSNCFRIQILILRQPRNKLLVHKLIPLSPLLIFIFFLILFIRLTHASRIRKKH